jgi:hypothetical protein
VLIGHSLRRIRAMLLGVALLLAAFQFLLTQVGAYLLRHGYFSQLSAMMPDFVRTMIGPQSLAFMSFTGIVGFGYFHPMVIAATVGISIAVATEPAGEIESRFVDLTLAREVTRVDVVARTVLVFVAAAAVILGLMMIGTWTGLTCCTPAEAPRPPARLIASLALSLGSVMVCWSGIALGAAAFVRRRAVAGASVGLAALGTYLLDYLGRAWEPAQAISRISPFHFFDPAALLAGAPIQGANVAVLVGLGVVGCVIGGVGLSRRDI